jgi:hypothetical protein
VNHKQKRDEIMSWLKTMMEKGAGNFHAYWINGTAAQLAREGYFISKERKGSGAIFRTHGAEWIHFAIPTPVITDKANSLLKKIMILYMTEGTAHITAVNVYDGPNKIASFDNIVRNGNHSTEIDNSNTWSITPSHKMMFGLGLSIKVDFGPPTKLGVPSIKFTSAGAVFVTESKE